MLSAWFHLYFCDYKNNLNHIVVCVIFPSDILLSYLYCYILYFLHSKRINDDSLYWRFIMFQEST